VGIEDDMQRLEIGNVGIDLWREGKGRPVLYLHPGDGFAEDDPFLALLKRHYDVLAPWHPGFGHSDFPKGWDTVDDLAYFYFDFLDQLDLSDVTLIGASFGGWIAAEMAVRGNSRLGRMVLIDPLGIRLGGPTTRDIADFHNTDAKLLETMKWANPEGRQRDLTKLDDHTLTAIVRTREAFAHYGWRPYMHNPVLTRWLNRIAVPTLVLWGEQDGIVTPDYGRAYAERIPGARFKTIANAGHYPQIEQPEATTEQVCAFIDG
jgi:pimeloyl-ACP methyl ester carboxylesterase